MTPGLGRIVIVHIPAAGSAAGHRLAGHGRLTCARSRLPQGPGASPGRPRGPRQAPAMLDLSDPGEVAPLLSPALPSRPLRVHDRSARAGTSLGRAPSLFRQAAHSSPSWASCCRLSCVSLVRRVLVFERNTPSFISVPSGSVSTCPLETVREPVRALYCRVGPLRPARRRLSRPCAALPGFVRARAAA